MDVLKALKQMKSESVSCVMTSPPYWALRDYGKEVETIWDEKERCEHNFIIETKKNPMDRGGKGQHDSSGIVGKMGDKSQTIVQNGFCTKCNAWKGQLGLEPTFDLYIKHLCDIFDEIKRVLRKDGTCWVNLGDTYYTKSGSSFENDNLNPKSKEEVSNSTGINKANELRGKGRLQDKNLCNIPARFSIEMQNRGWILRNEIIWYKRNCMPSSVRDRFTVDFEKIFFFVKSKKYWFEKQYDNIVESSKKDKRLDKGLVAHKKGKSSQYSMQYKGGELHNRVSKIPYLKQDCVPSKNSNMYKGFNERYAIMGTSISSFGKNKRCVWDITTQPYREAHFATFPEELCRTPILSGCPEFICSKCGKAREPIFERLPRPFVHRNKTDVSSIERYKLKYSSCSCSAPFIPGIVLDPFAGSGTTLKVARDLKRDSIGIEISKKYCDLIFKRLYNGNKPLINEFELIK